MKIAWIEGGHQVRFTGDVPADESPLPEGWRVAPDWVTPNGAYFDSRSGTFKPIVLPEGHIFDYERCEPVLDVAGLTREARRKRDRLLAASDWITLRARDQDEAVPQAWLDYRQALRDITEQEGFPVDVVWPEAPDA